MIKTRILAGCVALISVVFATTAQAQALTQFVTDAGNGATQLQRNAGVAVQNMCGTLNAGGGGFNLPDDGQRDAYLRCNELVQTAAQLRGNTTTTRSLNLNAQQLLAAVQQISGEELAAQGSMATQVSAGQFANIGGRLSALRFGTAAAAARGRVAALGAPGESPDPRQSYASLAGRHALGGGAASDAESPQVRSPWGWFLESSYGFGDKEQTLNEDPFDFDSYSVSTGSDYNFGSGVLGFAAGYDNYQADFNQGLLVSGGDVEVKGVSGSVFAAWFGAGWSLNGIGTYGKLESDVARLAAYSNLNAQACTPVPCTGANRSFTGSPDGSYVALGVTLGHDFLAGGWQISPSLSAAYRDVDIDGFDETDSAANGGLALRYQEQSIESKRSILGLALARPVSRPWGVLTPSLRAEWHHEFDDEPRTLRAKYKVEDQLGSSAAQDFNCTISCFSFLTNEAEADYGIAGVGLSAVFAQRVQLYLYYEAVLGISDLNANSLALGLRGQF